MWSQDYGRAKRETEDAWSWRIESIGYMIKGGIKKESILSLWAYRSREFLVQENTEYCDTEGGHTGCSGFPGPKQHVPTSGILARALVT